MTSSLERVVDATDKADFKIIKREFGYKTDLILHTGVFTHILYYKYK